MTNSIKALRPLSPDGHLFVVYGDCCSGIPGGQFEANFAAVNKVIAKLDPAPEFICFTGDHISDSSGEEEVVRAQWHHFFETEMKWLDRTKIPFYSTTSNHNTYNALTEKIFRETFQDIPQNGPPGQEGLSYFIRRGNLLLIFVNTSFTGLGGVGHVESDWLDRTLKEHADADFKLVIGHHPAYPVNGYALYPIWRIVPAEARIFWSVLVRHRVMAYFCSHIITFDVQAHEGVLQITTGGAGASYGPEGFMPGPVEYFHFIQASIDSSGLRYQVIDVDGRAREALSWPLGIPSNVNWTPITDAAKLSQLFTSAASTSDSPVGISNCVILRFMGIASIPHGEDQTLLCANDYTEGPEAFWIGIEAKTSTLSVRLVPEAGKGQQRWQGEAIQPGVSFDFQLAIHFGMGPGGILWRKDDHSAWTSLATSSARGAEKTKWPENWFISHAESGPEDRPFRGAELQISFYCIRGE